MDNKKIQTTQEYLDSAHRLGRIGTVCALLIMLGLPTIAAIFYKTFPSISQILIASAGLLAIFVPTAIGEVISFTPILGSSIYLTLLTGNVTNLKIPVVTTVLRQMDVPSGSEEADVISGIAVAVSSVTTIIIIALGVLLMIPLTPVLTKPNVVTATKYVLPALFGAMALTLFSNDIGGGVRVKNRLLGAIPACIVVIVIFVVAPIVLEGLQGVLIVVLLPVTYFFTRFLYRRGAIKVFLPGEELPKSNKG